MIKTNKDLQKVLILKKKVHMLFNLTYCEFSLETLYISDDKNKKDPELENKEYHNFVISRNIFSIA